jgi:hypothetical protein
MRLDTLWLTVSLLLFVVAAPCAIQAQSGRRNPKGSPSPPSPPPQAEPTPTPMPKTPVQPQIKVLVIGDIAQSIYISVPFPEKVPAWIAKRLRDASALSVMEGEMASRGEAVKRAKASTDTFIVFVRVDETDSGAASPRTNRSNLDNVHISYYVYAPVTGKAQSSGVVYMNQRSTIIGIGRTGIPPTCYPGIRGNDLYLLQASLEIASRVMSALHVSAPPPCT